MKNKRKYNHNLIKKYKPYKTEHGGFTDLRDYDLPKNVFAKFAEIQYHLHYMSKNPKYYMKYFPAQWQKAQELSGIMQIKLQKYNKWKE